MTLPEAPTNVRVITDDEVEHPVEVVYRGVDEEGNHLWVATMTYQGLPKGLTADCLPPHTAVSVEFVP